LESLYIAHVPTLLEHEHGDDGFVGRIRLVNFIGSFAQLFQLFFVLAGCGFGNFAVVFGVNDENRGLEFGTNFFEILAHFIAIARVINHYEKNGFLSKRLMFGITFFPFFDAKFEVIVVFFGEDGAFAFDQFGPACDIGDERMIVLDAAGKWDITNLGAILFARNLDEFKTLARKAVRIIVYEGKGRLKTLREQPVRKGYAAGFKSLMDHLNALLPRMEVVGQGIRREVPLYPEPAIRELIPNALIHQDFSMTGSGPMIEIFSDRMEITNPGQPLVKTERFLDSPPRSRNEALASFMRRLGICEERGSGVDKVVAETERYQLPAPLFETTEGFTRAILFTHRPLRKMDRADRTRACYLHACLRYVERDPMTNSTLRARLGISEPNKAMASRIISDAIKDGLVKPEDLHQGRKYAKYVPFWA
jgi:hypothetical protein